MLQSNLLNSLNTMELLSKIEEFKRLDLKTASMGDITMKVLPHSAANTFSPSYRKSVTS